MQLAAEPISPSKYLPSVSANPTETSPFNFNKFPLPQARASHQSSLIPLAVHSFFLTPARSYIRDIIYYIAAIIKSSERAPLRYISRQAELGMLYRE